MKIIFFGTPEYVLPIAKMLAKQYNTQKKKDFIAVVTQEPKVAGRKKFVQRSAVDNWAFRQEIDVIYNEDEIPDEVDLGIVASYGKMISEKTLKKFSKGILNIHPSALPKLRGASPIQAALAMGLEKTAISIIKMDEKMDNGPIATSTQQEIFPEDNQETLRRRLFENATLLLEELLPNYLNGKIKPKEQDQNEKTFTKTINKQDAYIPAKYIKNAIEGKTAKGIWEIPFITDYTQKPTPKNIHNFIRAMYSWPSAWTLVTTNGKETKRMKIISSNINEVGKLKLEKVQLEGKNVVTWEELLRGYSTLKLADNLEANK